MCSLASIGTSGNLTKKVRSGCVPSIEKQRKFADSMLIWHSSTRVSIFLLWIALNALSSSRTPTCLSNLRQLKMCHMCLSMFAIASRTSMFPFELLHCSSRQTKQFDQLKCLWFQLTNASGKLCSAICCTFDFTALVFCSTIAHLMSPSQHAKILHWITSHYF